MNACWQVYHLEPSIAVASQYINSNNKKQVFSHILRHCCSGSGDGAEERAGITVIGKDAHDDDDDNGSDGRDEVEHTLSDESSPGSCDSGDNYRPYHLSGGVNNKIADELISFHHQDSTLIPYLVNHIHHNAGGHLVHRWLLSDAFQQSMNHRSTTRGHTVTTPTNRDDVCSNDDDHIDHGSDDDGRDDEKCRREVRVVLRKAIVSKYGWMKGRKLWKRLMD